MYYLHFIHYTIKY